VTILLDADDIILLSPTVGGLQAMWDKCFEISCVLSLKFNVCKSHGMIIGRMYKKASIRWQDSARRQFQAGLIGDVGL